MSIRVLIADDQALFRETYVRIIEEEDDLEVVGSVENGKKAVEMAKKLTPDVALLDIDMPKLNGIETSKRIRAENPDTAIVLLSHYADRQYVEAFLGNRDTRGKAYLLKTTLNDSSELIRAIQVVARGGAMLAPEILSELTQLISIDSPLNDLTKRERQVLELMAQGYTNTMIARKLNITDRTVESHTNNIYNKLLLTEGEQHSPRVMAVLIYLDATQ
ncbi:response regulator transcription factor [Anaerolineales bacterium HSG6]|nr:response regulator transcription factor [Anaerolineales bacterium HSG6]MDM8529712.1 response regulator transcription factor [Anaerolineales bacterium HSG25]